MIVVVVVVVTQSHCLSTAGEQSEWAQPINLWIKKNALWEQPKNGNSRHLRYIHSTSFGLRWPHAFDIHLHVICVCVCDGLLVYLKVNLYSKLHHCFISFNFVAVFAASAAQSYSVHLNHLSKKWLMTSKCDICSFLFHVMDLFDRYQNREINVIIKVNRKRLGNRGEIKTEIQSANWINSNWVSIIVEKQNQQI